MACLPEKPRSRAAGTWLLLFVATLAAYWPALRGGFLWDDDAHVTKASLRSLSGLGRIWTQLGATQQYYPVLHSAFWVEHRLWGDSVLGYHLLNVLLHATAAWLFVLILQLLWSSDSMDRIQLPASLLAALLFALHPVCVESVAWISEQKNTLSLVFYLLSALVYLKGSLRRGDNQDSRRDAQAARPGSGGSISAFSFQLPAFILFLLALLSKSVTATLPGALLVVLWWKNGRLSWRKDVLPLIPWFIVGLASGLFTAWVEKSYIGARGASFGLGGLERCLLAGRAAWFYLGKLLWPANLMFVYPRWTVSAAQAWQYVFPVLALGALLVLWALRGKARGPLACALFFLGTLLPALGFVNVYPFIFSYVADHFQYLASLGIAAGAAWLFARYSRPAGLAAVCVLGVLTWRQAGTYRDVETLYRTSLAANPDSWMSHYNLGAELARQGRLQEAVDEFNRAVALRPDRADIRSDLGTALVRLGRLGEAIPSFREAVRLDPRFANAHLNLGAALKQAGRVPEAIAECEAALAVQPDYPEASFNLGAILQEAGRLPEAASRFEEALRSKPDMPGLRERLASVREDLGLSLAADGKLKEAVDEFRGAEALSPEDARAHFNLGLTLGRLDRLDEARVQFERALELDPAFSAARDALAQMNAAGKGGPR